MAKLTKAQLEAKIEELTKIVEAQAKTIEELRAKASEGRDWTVLNGMPKDTQSKWTEANPVFALKSDGKIVFEIFGCVAGRQKVVGGAYRPVLLPPNRDGYDYVRWNRNDKKKVDGLDFGLDAGERLAHWSLRAKKTDKFDTFFTSRNLTKKDESK